MGIVSRYGEMLAVQLQSEKICLPPSARAVCATDSMSQNFQRYVSGYEALVASLETIWSACVRLYVYGLQRRA